MVVEDDITGLIDSIEPVQAAAPAGEAPAAAAIDNDIQIPAPTGEAPEVSYTNETVKTVDEMYKKGATHQEVQNYFRLLNVSHETMAAEHLVREGLKLDNPKLSETDIDELYEEEYGSETGAKAKARLEKDADAVRARIAEMQDQAKTPAAAKQQQAQQAQLNKIVENWGQVADAVVAKRLSEINISVGDEFSFGFAVTEEMKPALKQAAIDYAVQERLSFDKDSIAKIQDHMTRVAYYMQGPEMVEAVVRDAIAKGLKLGLKQRVNPGNPREVNPAKGGENEWAKARRANPFS
jgi:hypothetical protein